MNTHANARLCPVVIIFSFLFSIFCFTAGAQSLQQDLSALTARPAVTGYEQALAEEIRTRLTKLSPQTDNLGNVWVTIGSGAPSRLIVAPMDEPGYVVSGITQDGYLRVQRLPQQAPNAVFDLLHTTQPVVIHTRKGKWVYGVVAGLSTHLQGGRQNPPRGAHPDEMYVDVGAASAAEVKQAGVDLLDPIGLDREMRAMGFGKLNAPGIGDRFGAAALLELLRRVDTSKVKGTLTVAFVAQQWASSRGLDRLMQHVKADEMIYVGRLLARRGGGGPQAQQQQAQPRAPKKEPGSGVLIGSANPDAALEGLAGELQKLAESNSLPAAADFTTALPRVSYTRGPELPARFAHLSIATAWASTPAEAIDSADLTSLAALLKLYAQTTITPPGAFDQVRAIFTLMRPPTELSKNEKILQALVESYGMSEHEALVREEVLKQLPAWAKPETDKAGNLVLRLPVAKTLAKPKKILFVAHMDEIGYAVRAITADGRLEVQSRGGGIAEFFSGHVVLVHAEKGMRPGIIELPAGWDQPNFEWPRGGAAAAAAAAAQGQAPRATRVDVGARTPLEVAQLGIKVGDWITVPKKYRKLFGTRANGRSFDDRVGCAALVSAVWALGSTPQGGQAAPTGLPVDVTFVWSTGEEIGLVGAKAVADRLAAEGAAPDFVFAVDTFVSADSPLESKRFGDAPIGKGFVIRAVDNSNITDRKYVDKVIALAKKNQIAVQYGVTGGGNDGAVYLRHGAVDIPVGWSLRYSHSPGEVIDTRDLDALARIVAAIARAW
ncbi:MAG: M20/M25/M40 family metallo-hydrolase [Acidobacteria bacterium]|nr:M20/M25/M40 family metallo-hydrolase [Acidobacteriota bacterium]MCL5288519.1 M20/M25/M40 family metallo-hydrolase [Acidobacteriota bacterium]